MSALSQKELKLRQTLEAMVPPEVDPHKHIHGVLLGDEIEFYSKHHNLISPFRRENLKPAAYELTIGDEYFLSGEFFNLDQPDSKIVIEPFEVMVIKTREILCLPRFLIARWNIRVKHAYSGLLWVGGPQVDPGYVGHLFCPIYNLSDKRVTLQAGDEIAVIDFVKTTPFDPAKNEQELKRYPHPPKRIILQNYDINDLQSALFTRAGQKLVEFEDEVRGLRDRFNFFTQISFAIFALVVSVLALSRGNVQELTLNAAVWGIITVFFSVWAFLIALFFSVQRPLARFLLQLYPKLLGTRGKAAQNYVRRVWWVSVSVTLLISLIASLGISWAVAPLFSDVRQQHFLVKSDVEGLTHDLHSDIETLSERISTLERVVLQAPKPE